ncbi:nucleotidyltransferase family protein [Pectobacterium brasiliense]|uniref:nucleotidyltransferase family protein n=1 Tax=Pectobacterium brasiliense TaxID=180957 RepID=UPI0032EC8D03
MEMKLFFRELIESYIDQGVTQRSTYECELEDDEFITYHKLEGLLFLWLRKKNQDCNAISYKKENDGIMHRAEGLVERNRKYLSIATSLMDRLNAINVEFVFLKGLSLILNHKQDISHRRFADIDILVPKERLSDVEAVLLAMGYQYGENCNGAIKKASRSDVIYQRLHTHEIHNMIMSDTDGFISNIDVNFHFSWKCPDFDEKRMRVLNFHDVAEHVIKIEQENNLYPVFDDTMQFIHLCCHLYNESRFFSLDRNYSEEKRYDLKLFRLVDIILLLHRCHLNIHEVYQYCLNINCQHKINYVLKAISLLYNEDIVKPFLTYFSFQKTDMDFFFAKNGKKVRHDRTLINRVFTNKK